MRIALLLLLAIVAIGLVGFAWQLFNLRGSHRRGIRRRGKDRRTPQSRHSKAERRIYREAQRLVRDGNLIPAARLLESNGMLREAVSLLESRGQIHEAARMLIRVRRPNRAGFIYARHGVWDKAAEMFRLANMPLEAAKSFREAGQLVEAASHFEKIGRLTDAAECHIKAGNLQRGARMLKMAGRDRQALEMYKKIAENATQIEDLDLDDEEIKLILQSTEGVDKSPLAEVLVKKNKITEVVKHLVQVGDIDRAKELYLKSTEDIGPQLIGRISYSDKSAETLAEVFMKASHFAYGGAVFEKMGSFEKAGEAYELAEDFELAANCFEKASMKSKAEDLRLRNEVSNPRLPDGVRGVNPSPNPEAQEKSEANILDFERLLSFSNYHEDTNPGSKAPTGGKPSPEVDDSGNVILSLEESKPQMTKVEGAKSTFHKVQLWSQLDFQQKEALWNIGQTKSFEPRQVILDYRDDPAGVYVILSGNVACFRNRGKQDESVGGLQEAECFGELWLLADIPTTVKFVAGDKVTLHVINRDAFMDLIDRDGRMARKVYRRFTKNLMTKLLKESARAGLKKAS